MPLSQNLADIPRLDLRDVPAVKPALRDLRRPFHALDELLDEYAAQEAEPPADLLRDHAQAQRAYNDAWSCYVAEHAEH